LKAQQQNSQQSKPVEVPVPKPVPVEIPKFKEEEDDFMEEDDADTEEVEKEAPKSSKEEISKEQQIMMTIEMLQNNGRYRAELLNQLQEINKALVVIAEVLVDQHGKKAN